jgi:hypothetical protein
MFRLIASRNFATASTASTPPGAPIKQQTSLWNHWFKGRGVGSIWKMWVSKLDYASFPVIGAIAAGLGLAGWFSIRGLMYNPDVKIDKLARKSTIRDNVDEGKAWVKHHDSIRRDNFLPKAKDSVAKA